MPRTKKMAPASAGGHDDAGASGQALTLWDRDRHRKDKPGSIRTFPAQVLISATSYLLPESARDLSRAALGCNCPVPAGFRRRRQPRRFRRWADLSDTFSTPRRAVARARSAPPGFDAGFNEWLRERSVVALLGEQ